MDQCKINLKHFNLIYYSLQLPVNALFFICYSFANFSAVWLFGHVVPTLGFNTMFFILGLMTVTALIIHMRVDTLKMTDMPFVTGMKGYEALALASTPG